MAENTSSLPHVVCLHSSGASGRQWRSLAATGAGGWHWHTPDLQGHGDGPTWPVRQPATLAAEADGVLTRLALPPGQRFHLVGHSYGGAVALKLALQQPQRVLSLTLYEPVAFGLLAALGPAEPARQEISGVAARLGEALDRGDADGAARGFCAYWHGQDVWPALDAAQRQRLAAVMPTVRLHFQALFAAAWSDAHLQRLRMPVRLLCGTATRASAARVAQCLAARLPRATLRLLEGAGHMAPLTEPQRLNACFLDPLKAL